MKILLSRIWALLTQRGLDRQLDDEIQAHLDLCADDYRARGLTPEAARAAARRDFGGIGQLKERYRDQLGLTSLDVLRQDLRYTFRTFRRTPGFTATAVLSLALGLGANTAIFGVMDALLLKTLPVARPEELFAFRGGDFSYPAYETFRQDSQAFAGLLATSGITELAARIQDGLPERTGVSFVSGSYFTVLGVSARLGRTFVANDDQAAAPIAVLSDGYWTRRFGRDPSILGRPLRIGNATVAIVGVTPPGFFGERVGAAPDLWMPLTTWGRTVPGRNLMASPTTSWLQIIGRLKPGREVQQVEGVLTVEYQHALFGTYPHAPDELRREIDGARVTLEPAGRGLSNLRSQFSLPLEILMTVAAVVLLIACANVANVLIARAAARQREIALRLALGIARARLVRQLLTESVTLSLAGGALGLVVAWLARESLLRLVSADGSRVPLAVATDGRLLAFAWALSVLTGVLFGLAPIWQAARVDLVSAITTSRAKRSASRRTIGRGLVMAQVALSVVLLTSATLFLRTLSNLQDVDLGFTREHLLILDVNPSAAGYRDRAYAALCERLLERLTALPGVAAATLSENGVLTGRDSSTNRMRPDDFVSGTDGIPTISFDVVGPRYFTTLGVPLRAGRDIDAHDVAAARAVVVINEAMARRFFGNQNPLGRTMLWGAPEDSRRLEVVGVSGDVRQHSPRDRSDLRFYVPYFQHGDAELASARLLVRTAADPSAMMASARRAILAEDLSLPIERVDTAQALVDRTLVRERMIAVLSTAFTGLALLLACVGLYGLMSYCVVQRTGEIGVRMALGAARHQVVWMVLRQDATWIAVGIAIGGLAAVIVSRYIRSLLFGIDAGSPSTIIVPILVMLAAGVVAGVGPAARAARIDPALSLRHD